MHKTWVSYVPWMSENLPAVYCVSVPDLCYRSDHLLMRHLISDDNEDDMQELSPAGTDDEDDDIDDDDDSDAGDLENLLFQLA